MKPTILISTRTTDQVNRANVAQKLFDHVSHEAGRRVWDAPAVEWMSIAREYVNLESHDRFGTTYLPPDQRAPLSPHTELPPPLPASQHLLFPENRPISEGGNALTKIKRFLGLG